MLVCPKCNLRCETIWECDGCGNELRKDYESIRTELRAHVRSARIGIAVMVLVDLVVAGGFVVLAMHGVVVISFGLLFVAAALTKASIHKLDVMREDQRRLEQRHPQLPRAIVT